jgi:hypothetical protein
MLAYTACIWFAIVYLGEHWVVDIIGGVTYASVAYFAVMHAPAWGRRFMAHIADEEIEGGVEAEEEGDVGAVRRLRRRVRWGLVAQGVALVAVGGVVAYGMNSGGWFGGSGTPLYLLPWLAILGGGWRGARAFSAARTRECGHCCSVFLERRCASTANRWVQSEPAC